VKTTVSVGDINEYGIQIVSGPYLGKGQGHSTTWGFLCKYCSDTFISSTYKFKFAKSCYKCTGVVRRKSSAEISWKNHYYMLKSRKIAKEKGFDITLEQFVNISKQNCFYCNDSPTPTKGHRPWSEQIFTNGLDRIDSSLGYLYNNVVACCKFCNFAKLDKTEEEFYSWIKRLVKHQSQKGNM
jgi:hypothetical protein